MATIALYANKINQMSGLINDVKQSVNDYKSELHALQLKTLAINSNICVLDDVISSVQSSTQMQEDKMVSLDMLRESSEEFVSDAVCIDEDVADIVTRRKDDFYEEYYYLKPECEKSGWEKFKDECKKIGEWCKEHWITILTVIVVVVIAAVAVVCGVAIAFIAAVAGIVALALCTADVICMLVTGGKDIATVLRENGFDVLADIFQGVSIGADIVSIAFPIGAALKTMAKIGVKTFAKVSIKAAKVAFKETIEKVFKSGFKNGVKNALKIVFKSLVFDIDDFTKMQNGKKVLNIWESTLDIPSANKHWTVDGDKLIPKSDSIPSSGKGGHNNPDRLSMKEIMGKYSLDAVSLYKNGDVNWNDISICDVNIKGMTDVRKTSNGVIGNFNKANEILKLNNTSKEALEKQLNISLTWHEDVNLKTMHLIPTEIHANIRHVGGVGNYKFTTSRIAEQLDTIIQNIFKFSTRDYVNSIGQ